MEITKDLEVMQTEVTADSHTYVDIVVDDFKLTLDSVESIRSLFLGGTSSRKAQPPLEN